MKLWASVIPGVLFIAAVVVVYILSSSGELGNLQRTLEESGHYSELVYVLLLVGAVVLMPLTVMPLIPIATAMFGPLMTGFLSIAGWTLGGMIAFLISRYLGRPVVKYFVSLDTLDQALMKIPSDSKFFMIVLLRLTLPVDIISYVLGLSKGIKFWEYTGATLIGVSWFSFAFAYLGEALYEGNLLLFIEIGAVSVLIFTIAGYLICKKYKRNS